jgi:hypothetical protein
VQVVEVDNVDPETQQRRVARRADVRRVAANLASVVARAAVDPNFVASSTFSRRSWMPADEDLVVPEP